MTKQDVIKRIHKKTGTDPEIGRAVLEVFFEVVKSAVAQGDTVYMRTFGSFGPKRRAAKVARNLKHNTAMQVEAHTIPAFRPSPEFVNQVRQRGIKELRLEQAKLSHSES